MKQPKGDWTDLFLTFRLSLDPRKLWLALQGVVASLVLIGLVLGVAASVYHAHGASFAADTDVWGSLVHGRIQPAARETIVFGHRLFGAAPVPQPPDGAMTPVDSVLASGQLTAGIVTGLLILLGMLLVWSHFGVPLMRLAAVEYATGERIELKSATAYGKREHHKFYGAVLGLLAVVVLIGLGSLVAGFVAVNVLAVAILVVGATGAAFVVSKMRSAGRPLLISGGAGVAVLVLAVVLCAVVAHKGWRVPYVGEVLLGLSTPLLFIGGIVTAVLVVWCVTGAALMAGTVATSETDTFDVWSRAFHYVFSHPWRYLSLILVASAHGVACMAFVHLLRVLTEWAVLAPLAMALQEHFAPVYGQMMASGSAEAVTTAFCPAIPGFFLFVCRNLLLLTFLTFVAAYSATAKALIYMLMRRYADGTPISEVHLEPRDRELICPASPDGEG